MGMYTELLLKCEVNEKKMHGADLDYFRFITGQTKECPQNFPDHEFFTKDRCKFMFTHSSFYHHPSPIMSYCDGYLFCRIDIKNYEGEIEAFLDWILPVIAMNGYDTQGWIWPEYADNPTLLQIDWETPVEDRKWVRAK